MKKRKEKLKPCPFCGGEAQIFHTPEILAMEETGYHAEFLHCGATLPEEKMPFIAVQEWNTRADLRPQGRWLQHDEEDANAWECSVGHNVWQLMDGSPAENGMKYCQSCGAEMTSDGKEE
mgnify:CR=1 FL=1